MRREPYQGARVGILTGCTGWGAGRRLIVSGLPYGWGLACASCVYVRSHARATLPRPPLQVHLDQFSVQARLAPCIASPRFGLPSSLQP